MNEKFLGGWFSLLFLLGLAGSVSAQPATFTYQGQLNDGGAPATGLYDLKFSLFTSTNVASPVAAGPITNTAVGVTNGIFTTQLNFGSGVFTGTNYWVEIAVRSSGAGSFTTLSPRQFITSVPYAIFSGAASNLLGMLPATQLSGTLPSAQISGTYTGPVNFSNSANLFQGAFNGDASSLSNLNASQLTTGTVEDARLSGNVALLNADQSFAGANQFNGVNTFTNMANSFRGSFFGNGLVGWIATNGTAVQAVIDTGYVLTSSQLVTVTLPTSPNVGDIIRISGAGAGGWRIAQNAGQSVIGNFLSYSNSYWTLVEISDNWQSIASSADGNKLVACTTGNGIFVYSSGLWTAYTTSPTGAYGVASSADGNKLFAAVGGNSGSIYLFTNGATQWIKPSGAPTGYFRAVAASANGTRVVAVTSNNILGYIYVSTNSGATWTAKASLANVNAVASSADGSKLIASTYNGYVYVSTDSGNTWNSKIGIASWAAVAASADGSKLFAANGSGYIYTSNNSGSSWTQSSAPSGTWSGVTSSADGVNLAATLRNGGIYVSSNSGLTWTKQAGAPAPNWNAIASSADGSRLAAVVNSLGGGLYLSSASTQITTVPGTNGYVSGGPGTAVELQYIGNNQFMPVSSVGTLWAN